MTDAIGGYFGEEELEGKFNTFIHESGMLLNSGRNAFKYICMSIPRRVEKVYIPYYTCPVVWRSLFWNGLEYFYHINRELEIAEDIQLGENDYIVINNYFGIKDAYIKQMAEKYGNHLIVDNAQAFYAPTIPDTYAFYSPRKFFGVPDGGVAFVTHEAQAVSCNEQDDSYGRLRHLQLRKEKGAEAGFATYQVNENKLDYMPMLKMSQYTHDVLKGINYEGVRERRIANYKILHDALSKKNELSLPKMDDFACPMVYPFIGQNDNGVLRKALRDNRIYTATYWPNIDNFRGDNTSEEYLAHNIIPLPIDQRYGKEEMNKIILIINNV